MAKIGTELLNIKQAAEYLNVSEVSIRRWTDAGKLACLRVGDRRERRFRHQDLVDYLEKQSSTEPVITKQQRIDDDKISEILLEGIAINHGDHICSLYETHLGCIKLSVPFLADGLRRKDKCFLVASKLKKEHILQSLAAAYPDTESDIGNFRLVVSEGLPTGHELYDYFEQEFLEATRHGDQYIRVLNDMAWAVDKGMSVDDLMAFERNYNHSLAKSFAAISLCQYDARVFAGTEILRALKCHEDTFKYPMSRLVGF